jgi:anti-sigma B factor antagonist
MSIKKSKENELVVLTVDGKIDALNSPAFEEAVILALEEASEVTVDLMEVEFITSVGLRVLLLGHNLSKEKNKIFRLRNVPEGILGVLDLTGFSEFLIIEK